MIVTVIAMVYVTIGSDFLSDEIRENNSTDFIVSGQAVQLEQVNVM